ncbi:MAG: sulfite exporter TauE/SafE family protein [Magnetococcales bacterium]|nr:sulfite exporter TauE/SafE family protein [Magnetococcales bacterium]MBF0115539.1 sulfite exporter TauE/SafE family protein [Magnetococcales bacterium]
MDLIVIAAVSCIVSLTTLYSGFGLGTVLMPIFALFLPLQTAVAATAVVHFSNNLFKVMALGRHVDRELVLRFGVPAIAAAFAGAALLGVMGNMGEIVRYDLAGREAVITPIKLVMALLMLGFALLELLPGPREKRFDRRYLPLGGILSGFFGGLSGHQGALRSAFLSKASLSTEQFVGSNAWIGLLVDASRLLVYGNIFAVGTAAMITASVAPLVGAATLGAFMGIIIGKRFLRKVTMATVQKGTGLLLLIIAVALGLGVV